MFLKRKRKKVDKKEKENFVLLEYLYYIKYINKYI